MTECLRTGVLLSLLLIPGFQAVALPSSRLPVSEQPPTELELSTTVVAHEYCATDHLRLRLRFRFTNLGKRNLIVFRYGVAVTRQMYSRSYKNALAGNYVEDIEPFVQPIITASPGSDTPNRELFVFLKAGESYDTDQDFHVLFNAAKDAGSNSLRPGDYFVQIQVSTWWWGKEKATTLRERWHEYGFLWSQDLTSLPMPIHIEQTPQPVKCEVH